MPQTEVAVSAKAIVALLKAGYYFADGRLYRLGPGESEPAPFLSFLTLADLARPA
jgi:hypothetical protein